jgi:CCR4-NOT transcription complex subunit 7/8
MTSTFASTPSSLGAAKLFKDPAELINLESSFSEKNPLNMEEESGIKEVWAENLEEEFQKIIQLVDNYNNISIDTEFPGFCVKGDSNSNQDAYTLIKSNVDKLKLIQVGITLSDDKGNMPHPTNTWQFNLKFDLE